MSNLKKSKNHSVSYNGFGGINHTARFGEGNFAESMDHFRILKNGTIEKRHGYSPIAYLGYNIRALYSTTQNGQFMLFTLIDDKVYTVDCTNCTKSLICTVSESDGYALFFSFGNILYLTDSLHLYAYDGTTFNPIEGYAPLFGKDWPSNVPGKVNEPRNILTRNARITYIVDELPTIYLHTKYPVESVQAVYVNGSQVPESRYSINDAFTTVDVSSLRANDRVEVYLTFKDNIEPKLTRLLGADSFCVFGGTNNNRICLAGGGAESTAFISRYVSPEDLYESAKHFPPENTLYFPDGDDIDVGGGINHIKAVTQDNDRLLFFTEGNVWTAKPSDFDGYSPYFSILNSDIGCISDNGAISLGDCSVSIGKDGIWLWKGQKATKISLPIEDILTELGLQNFRLLYERKTNELWAYDTVGGSIFIYNLDNEQWFMFSNIYARNMLDIEGRPGFINNNVLYVFDSANNNDLKYSGQMSYIRAYYISRPIDFGTAKKKNLCDMTIYGDIGNERLILFTSYDCAPSIYFNIYDNSQHYIMQKRLYSGRFHHFSFKFESNGWYRQSLHKTTFYIK